MYKFILDKIKRKLLAHLTYLSNSAINTVPNDSSAYNNRAILTIGDGNLQQSLQDMNNAIALNTQYHHLLHYQNSAIRCFRGYTHLFLKKHDLAQEDLSEAIFQDHNNNDAIKCQNLLKKESLDTNKFDWVFKNKNCCYLNKLTTEFSYTKIDIIPFKVIQANTTNQEKADLFFSLGNYKEALRYVNNAIKDTPSNTELYYSKAIIHYNLKKFAAAIEDLLIFVKEDSDNKYALCDLAMAYLMNSQYKLSLKYYCQCLELDEEYSSAYLGMGLAYFFQKKFRKAKEYLDKAVVIASKEHREYHINSSVQFYNRGFIYYQMKQLDLCINDLNKSLDLHRKNIDALLLRAKIYMQKENFNNALEDVNIISSFEENIEAAELGRKIEKRFAVLG